jgi:hypothetical protein
MSPVCSAVPPSQSLPLGRLAHVIEPHGSSSPWTRGSACAVLRGVVNRTLFAPPVSHEAWADVRSHWALESEALSRGSLEQRASGPPVWAVPQGCRRAEL